jgi:urease accessory protein UreF
VTKAKLSVCQQCKRALPLSKYALNPITHKKQKACIECLVKKRAHEKERRNIQSAIPGIDILIAHWQGYVAMYTLTNTGFKWVRKPI